VNKVTTLVGLVMLVAAAAWGADCVVEGRTGDVVTLASYGADDQLELSWDTGTPQWSIAWYSGAGAWVGNDFDLSTISTYRAVEKVRFYSRDNWPNAQWDGFRVGLYDFKGAVPGSILWPTSGGGYFFKPSGLQGHVWVDVRIGWTCPTTAFVAAVEQYYNYPNCDPFALGNNTSFRGHSWQYYQGQWSPYEGSPLTAPYRNIMLRVIVDNETLGVAPTSLGRVKALYY
jgi:hypothetical protein